ncbi:phospho-sugar mutase [Geosporobacter ferrireducens]|uniref:phosphoglucomutase (alpha-D-glucose-1,6-bisphosphate-dependent) n=1 Tax=Geosporobacter ferrireducens TaxID=1424294 RepID=A0A1D8GGL5_9FIRM|nr:phospho-sugar mutase [Geosporobacter ferrireducens]AOT70054.1 phosphoglucomutase [Geosporobacter ferrireducens]
MNYREIYEEWLRNPYFDQEIKKELKGIEGEEKEIEERFYRDLEFGTGGLRGVIGAGTNRMNIYTVRRATQGFGEYLIESVESAKEKGVVIAYDSRHKSPEFAEEAALVLCANGIKAYLFDALRTTPELSFAIRELGCAGGIVVTASHNPPEYNGYKVYGEDGGQLVPEDAEKVIEKIQQIHDYSTVPYLSKREALEKGLLQIIGEEIDQKYIERVKSLVLRPELIHQLGTDLKVIYTPLHGTGNMAVRRVLREAGFENIFVVPEQELPDPNFTTVKSPNPEEHEAFTLALDLTETVKPDVIIGTDPDCDRIGAVVQNKQGDYEILTGNQTGALLIDYILSAMEERKKLPVNGVVVKTIVTSEMGAEIARSYGMATLDTLTGFKFIGEKIKEFEKTGEKEFVFGYEESYGYLAGTFVRDKDAVIAALLICEMAAYYKTKDMTLYDGLLALFEKYGYYQEGLTSITLKGKEGMEKILSILNQLRENTPKSIGDKKVKLLRDYEYRKEYNLFENREEDLTLPQSDVLHFTMEDGSWFCVRPSGTEPKIKIYFSVVGKSLEDAKAQLQVFKYGVMDIIHSML